MGVLCLSDQKIKKKTEESMPYLDDIKTIWEMVKASFKPQMIDSAIDLWFGELEVISFENNLLTLGTSSELKEQKIISKKLLQKTKVLEDNDFNKDYFTQIDIRTDKEIKLYSKDAKLLTAHPEGTYELVKDDKGQLILKITNPNKFWSVSRYLVIEVK